MGRGSGLRLASFLWWWVLIDGLGWAGLGRSLDLVRELSLLDCGGPFSHATEKRHASTVKSNGRCLSEGLTCDFWIFLDSRALKGTSQGCGESNHHHHGHPNSNSNTAYSYGAGIVHMGCRLKQKLNPAQLNHSIYALNCSIDTTIYDICMNPPTPTPA